MSVLKGMSGMCTRAITHKTLSLPISRKKGPGPAFTKWNKLGLDIILEACYMLLLLRPPYLHALRDDNSLKTTHKRALQGSGEAMC